MCVHPRWVINKARWDLEYKVDEIMVDDAAPHKMSAKEAAKKVKTFKIDG